MKIFLFIFYPIFLILITLFSYLFIDPNFFPLQRFYSGFMLDHRFETTLIYTISIILFFILYFSFLFLVKKEKINLNQVKKMILISVVILFFAYPAMLSFDIFNYLATSKVLFFYHENPYLVMPIEFNGDPLLLFIHAPNKIALYGPFWILITGIPYLFSFGNILFNVFFLKIVSGIFYLLTTLLIWKISKNRFCAVLFALNPLILIETIVSGHNDIVMMFFALFSFYLLTKRRIALAIIFLILSILIKYATLFLIPVFVYALFKTVIKEKINREAVFYFSSLSMILIFLFSPIREEIYPWYAIWFLTFTFLIPEKKILLYFSIALSFGLLLRYVPFMLLGTYFGATPFIKIAVTFIPAVIVFLYFSTKKLFIKNNA